LTLAPARVYSHITSLEPRPRDAYSHSRNRRTTETGLTAVSIGGA
jgi:hypothetical protein